MKMGLEQRFASIVNKGDLLRPITPDTDPEEAIARLQEYNRRDLTATSIARRRDHLRQVGVADLDTWTFFSNPALSETQEDSLQFLRDHWPLGIESLLVPGQWSGGRGESSDLLAGRAEIIVITGPAKFTPSGHTIYLRVAKV